MAAPAWTPADQVAFARSVVPLLSRWESDEADAYFARHLPGYADDLAILQEGAHDTETWEPWPLEMEERATLAEVEACFAIPITAEERAGVLASAASRAAALAETAVRQ